MKTALRLLLPTQLFAAALFLGGCAGPTGGIQESRVTPVANVQSEAPGDYWVGRRYYKPQFKFWGYVRRPGQPWKTAQLVMMNEKQKLAPDREANKLGSDNNFEYKLFGDYSGDKVYEPASNAIYPEFVLKNYELISNTPPPIFKSQTGRGRARAEAGRLWIEKPE